MDDGALSTAHGSDVALDQTAILRSLASSARDSDMIRTALPPLDDPDDEAERQDILAPLLAGMDEYDLQDIDVLVPSRRRAPFSSGSARNSARSDTRKKDVLEEWDDGQPEEVDASSITSRSPQDSEADMELESARDNATSTGGSMMPRWSAVAGEVDSGRQSLSAGASASGSARPSLSGFMPAARARAPQAPPPSKLAPAKSAVAKAPAPGARVAVRAAPAPSVRPKGGPSLSPMFAKLSGGAQQGPGTGAKFSPTPVLGGGAASRARAPQAPVPGRR